MPGARSIAVSMAALAPLASTARPQETGAVPCREIVTAAVAAVAEVHWDAVVRDRARQLSPDFAVDACSRADDLRSAMAIALAEFDDPAVRFLEAEAFERMLREWRGEAVVGVGLTEVLSIDVDEQTRRVTIVTPVPESPAEAAGLRGGDVVVSIDGIPTDTLRLGAVMAHLRGPEGTRVTLEIEREGETLEVPLGRVSLPSLDPLRIEWRNIDGDEIASLGLRQFTPGLADRLRATLETLEPEGTAGYVLDLRRNPGGLVDALIGVASLFLASDQLIARLEGPQPGEVRTPPDGAPVTDRPLAVLVGPETASAAELLAGALQAHGRARVFGSRTYGKGLAHAARELPGGAVLMLPIGRARTPTGRDILDMGIVPDVETDTPVERAVEFIAAPARPAAGP